MSKDTFPMTLVIMDADELDALRRAINVQFEVENDNVLDDVISSAVKICTSNEQSDGYVNGQLHQFRQDAATRIDALMAISRLRERIS